MLTTSRVGTVPMALELRRPKIHFGQHTHPSALKLLNNPIHHYPPLLKALNHPISKISQEDLVSTILALKAAEPQLTHRAPDTQRIHHEMAEVLMTHVHTASGAQKLQTTIHGHGGHPPMDRVRALLQATAKKSSGAVRAEQPDLPTALILSQPDKLGEWTHYMQWVREHKGQDIRNQSLAEVIPSLAEEVKKTWIYSTGHPHQTHFLLQVLNALISHVDNASLAKQIVKDPRMNTLFVEKPDAVNPILKAYLTKFKY